MPMQNNTPALTTGPSECKHIPSSVLGAEETWDAEIVQPRYTEEFAVNGVHFYARVCGGVCRSVHACGSGRLTLSSTIAFLLIFKLNQLLICMYVCAYMPWSMCGGQRTTCSSLLPICGIELMTSGFTSGTFTCRAIFPAPTLLLRQALTELETHQCSKTGWLESPQRPVFASATLGYQAVSTMLNLFPMSAGDLNPALHAISPGSSRVMKKLSLMEIYSHKKGAQR